MTGILAPEILDGRRLWIDPVMADVIHKLHTGDATKGWSGDPRLEVYFEPTKRRWELWRLEDDNEYRLVCRSAPDVVFDDRLIELLVANDKQRGIATLGERIVAQNDERDRVVQQRNDDHINEEVIPRMNYALRKDGLI